MSHHLLFISDLHLAADRPALLERFFALLEREAGRCQGLYVLGDLFDAWIGDDDPAPLADEVRRALKRFSRRSPLYLQHGNRDFMLGEQFAFETGACLLQEAHVLELDGRRLLLMHGDQLCTDDADYQAVRRQLRTPGFREQALRLPIPERRRLAAEYRRRSGEAQSLKPADIMDVNPDAVRDALRRHHASDLIHGHTHRPGRHSLTLEGTPATRWVLPDWREEEPRLGLVWQAGRWHWLSDR